MAFALVGGDAWSGWWTATWRTENGGVDYGAGRMPFACLDCRGHASAVDSDEALW